jgi:hypothetical protein
MIMRDLIEAINDWYVLEKGEGLCEEALELYEELTLEQLKLEFERLRLGLLPI